MEKHEDKLQRSIIELQFITATQNQKSKGLKGALNRAGLYEMLIRCAEQKYGKADLGDKLPEFFESYLDPTVSESEIRCQRHQIRKNKALNNYLVDNSGVLRKIYIEMSERAGGFTMNSVQRLINEMADGELLGHEALRQCFLFAKMTV